MKCAELSLSTPAYHFELLRAGSPAERATWERVWAASGHRRPHDHPAYLEFMCPTGHEPVAVYLAAREGGQVLYPFHLVDLAQVLPDEAGAAGAHHIVSPYGYGGPLYIGPPSLRPPTSALFREAFARFVAAAHVVSEFVREDLFADRLVLREPNGRQLHQDNVVVRLGQPAERQWETYKHKVRKNVKRAQAAGLECRMDEAGAELDSFLRVYHATMTRTNADPMFFIGAESFARLIHALAPQRGLAFVHVLYRGEVISTELLLLSSDTIYSFLGGTLEQYFELRPNDLLKHETIAWGSRRGMRAYVLGGGQAPDDGIFKYKEAFDPTGRLPFHVAKLVHDPALYDALVARRQEHEPRSERPASAAVEFFPAYLAGATRRERRAA